MLSENKGVMKQNTTNKNIIIPFQLERLKIWFRWMLEVTSWMISLVLLAASAMVAAVAAFAWLITGSETVLTLGIVSGLLLGTFGVWQLLRRLDQTVKSLKCESPNAA